MPSCDALSILCRSLQLPLLQTRRSWTTASGSLGAWSAGGPPLRRLPQTRIGQLFPLTISRGQFAARWSAGAPLRRLTRPLPLLPRRTRRGQLFPLTDARDWIGARRSAGVLPPLTRGLHSSTFRLNVSTFCGIRWLHNFILDRGARGGVTKTA
jgi:hypothetical protein